MTKTQTSRRLGPSPKKTSRPSSVTAAELLLEIGVEELPYQFIAPALAALKDSAEQLFKDQRLTFQSARTMGTPRRLTLVVEGVATQQTSMVKETMGPSKAVAFDPAGQPTRAAIGFARGQGVPVESLRVRQTPRGEYLFAVKEDAGRPTKTVLLEILPQIVGELSFPKAMKWNEAGVRFARPVRWLVALYGGAVLPIEFGGIKAGNKTYGHRVMGNGKAITVSNHSAYCRLLKQQGVLPDQEERRIAIREQLEKICKDKSLGLNDDEDLLDQAVYTTEWPHAIIGSFKPAYLELPQEILITSMKEHQGFFSLMHKETRKLAPHFIAVANNRATDMGLIRAGNERVLAARLADAKFFFDEDRKVKLEERAKKLSGVTFHQKLGTMAQKQERVAKLATTLAQLAGLKDIMVHACRRAGELCKADLLTGIVGEFPTLQGVMGGYYARFNGEDDEVAVGIGQHYQPHSMEGPIPASVIAQVLSVADRLDSLAAFFHVGIVPTGSEDPFALRRHATAVVRILLEGHVRLNLGRAVQEARAVVAAAGIKAAPIQGDAQERLVDFLFERVRHYVKTVHALRDDVINAVLTVSDRQSVELRDLVAKMTALESVTTKPEFDPLIIGFKRAHRLVEKERWDRKPIDKARFEHPSESALYQAIAGEREKMMSGMTRGEYGQALDALVRLKPAIDAFFTAVMVNAEDPDVRSNRLSLLQEVDDFFNSFADFSQIVVQGS